MKPSLQGHLLIAAPRLMDPNFFRSVILIVQHNDEGAMGLVLNRPLDITVQAAWEQVSEIPCQAEGNILQGGPCDGPLMAVHGDAKLAELFVLEGVCFSTEKDSLEKLVLDQSPVKFFVGYSGWGAGQLESELEQGGWLVIPATAEQVFSTDEELWRSLHRLITRATAYPGIDPRRIPPDPSVN
jgi:putative transcriptional regulator